MTSQRRPNVAAPSRYVNRLLRAFLPRRLGRAVVLVLYVLASVGVGFAHRVDPLPADLAQYMLPDGTIPTICGGKQSNDNGGHAAHRQICDACCLTHAPGVPPSETAGVIRLQTRADDVIPASEPIRTFLALVGHRPRGPPAA